MIPRRMATNGLVQQLYDEEQIGFVDLWDGFVGKEEIYMWDCMHIDEKEAAVLAGGLIRAV